MSDITTQIVYWKTTGQRNLKTAEDLFKTKHYDACLFFCHLTLEKHLKGMVVACTKDFPPYIHDLAKLVKLTDLDLSDQNMADLRMITTFNIAGRYDDIKLNFYKQCTLTFTKKYLSITKQLCQIIIKKYPKL
ncbi:MAG: HEPN domain-containing protein [Patescibacteria group bacterium]